MSAVDDIPVASATPEDSFARGAESPSAGSRSPDPRQRRPATLASPSEGQDAGQAACMLAGDIAATAAQLRRLVREGAELDSDARMDVNNAKRSLAQILSGRA